RCSTLPPLLSRCTPPPSLPCSLLYSLFSSPSTPPSPLSTLSLHDALPILHHVLAIYHKFHHRQPYHELLDLFDDYKQPIIWKPMDLQVKHNVVPLHVPSFQMKQLLI